MVFNTKELTGVAVSTRSGQVVGRAASFDLDGATGRLMHLHVKTKGLVSGLMGDVLMVSWDAIIEITKEKIVIADAAVEIGGRLARVSTMASSPTLMKEG